MKISPEIVLRYSNAQHSYAFPRIMAMLGDGETEYDLANDGKANSIAACSVRHIYMIHVVLTAT